MEWTGIGSNLSAANGDRVVSADAGAATALRKRAYRMISWGKSLADSIDPVIVFIFSLELQARHH